MTRRIFVGLMLVMLGVPHGFTATNPPYSIQQKGGCSWLAAPEGKRFFSLGVCVVNQGASASEFTPTNPGYAAFQHYENSEQWAGATSRRLASWGFTTVGGWSDYAALRQCGNSELAFIPVLAVGMRCGAPWLDMWDTNVIARMHQVAREQILPLRDEPRLLGYYSDNEMGWWNSTLFKMTLEQPATSGQRQRLLRLLRENFHNDWTALQKDFESEGANSFEELEQHGKLYLRPGSNGIRVYRRFLGMMAERYYSLVREIIRSYDPRGLILGDRYQSFYYPEVVRGARKSVDAISSNLNAASNDGTFPRFYLETLHQLSRKPVIVSEFYMAAQQNRSGNQNDVSTFPVVNTQAERAAGFRNTITPLAQLPYVLGADWFQYYDEPTYGRGDGENYNFGLVDIHDQPYEALVSAAKSLDFSALRSAPTKVRTDASSGIPPAPREPLAHFTIRLALADWDRERGFVKPVSKLPVADLYACWDKDAVYLGVYAQDIVDDNFYRTKAVPEVDRALWSVTVKASKKTVHARLGPGAEPIWDEPSVRVVNLSGVYMNTRNIAAMELPAKLFGKKGFKAGDSIEFESTLFTHARGDKVDWKGRFLLIEH